MGLRLDFIPSSPWRAGTVFLLVLGVALSAFALWQRQQLLERREVALARIDASLHAAASARPRVSTPAAFSRKEAVDEAERIVNGLQRPWEPMLNALQSAIRDDVLVQRVQPETDAFRLRITGQAESSQAFIEFVQRLQGDALWRTVEPLSEVRQPEAAASGGTPVAFQLAVQWKP